MPRLTEQEQQEIVRYSEADKPLPDKFHFSLFEDKREVALVWKGKTNGAAYAASKFGLIGFTQSLYEEVREHGIKVSVILPGFVDTPLIPPNRQIDRSKMIQADDIAQAVHYVLTSPATCCPVEITVRPQRTPYR